MKTASFVIVHLAGDDVSLATLLAISGDVSNKFEIDGFGEFDGELQYPATIVR